MTTYPGSAITDAVIAYQKPITLQQGRGFRDLPLSMFEGAAGAPRLQFAAIDTWFSTAGAIGTVAFLGQDSGTVTTIVAGTTYAGSGLKYAGFETVTGLEIAGATVSGTWRALGSNLVAGVQTRATLFQRIA